MVKNHSGQQLVGTNNQIKQQASGTFKKGETISIQWSVDNVFSDGTYDVDIAINDRDGVTVCDWWEEALSFEVVNEERVPYPFNPPITLQISKVSAKKG